MRMTSHVLWQQLPHVLRQQLPAVAPGSFSHRQPVRAGDLILVGGQRFTRPLIASTASAKKIGPSTFNASRMACPALSDECQLTLNDSTFG
jgi:hypothetical protein